MNWIIHNTIYFEKSIILFRWLLQLYLLLKIILYFRIEGAKVYKKRILYHLSQVFILKLLLELYNTTSILNYP